ncbi:DUF6684 family protein [Salinirubellus sp. GCM10025818]|jgi:hypothetical protein|uniref:DUF6684 family protein n=1 Tax=Salinirubellus TaxID=2162630 RepID=UPI0030D0F82B
MASATPFDRDTLLDLTVNAIPLGIMLFFIAVFLLVNPFGSDPVGTVIQISIVAVTFVALFILTYVSGKAISKSERELEEKGIAGVSESVGADDAEDETVAGELETGEADGTDETTTER